MRKHGLALKSMSLAALSLALALPLGGFGKPIRGALRLVSSLVSEPSSVSVTPNCSIPEELGIPEYRRGLKISAMEDGASVVLAQEMSGPFTLDFMPYSATPYALSSYEGTARVNAYEDIRTMSIEFKDLSSGKAVSIRLDGGGYGNNVTAMASVIGGSDGRVGIYYGKDSEALGNTTLKNAQGAYTYLYGTSFSDVAVHNGSYSSGNVSSIKVSFDPASMRFSGHSYGYSSDEGRDLLIADLSADENDGVPNDSPLEPFSSYKVTLKIDDIATEERPGNLLIFSLNDQDMDSYSIANTAGPTVSYEDGSEHLLGSDVTVSYPSTYDVLDGESAGAVYASVSSPSGSSVPLYSKEDGSLLSSSALPEGGAYFTPDGAGEYTLTLTAVDSEGLSGESRSFPITVVSTPVPRFSYSLPKTDFLIGERFTIPSARVSYGEAVYIPSATLLTPSGSTVSSGSLTLDEAGGYILTFEFERDGKTYSESVNLHVGESTDGSFEAEGKASFSYGEANRSSLVSGLRVSVSADNAGVSYKEKLPLSLLKEENTLISLQADPASLQKEADSVIIRLTDSADSSNYVTVSVKASADDDEISFVRAASSEQALSGLGDDGTVRTESSSGTSIVHSFSGDVSTSHRDDEGIEISLDYETKEVFANGGKLVADLDDQAYFKSKWAGFKGDGFHISVYFSGLSSQSASFLIESIGGLDLSHSVRADGLAPNASVAYDECPVGAVGVPYPILPFKLTDNLDPSPLYSVSVSYNDEAVSVSDGAFTPAKAGLYDIEFSFYDHSGNVRRISRTALVKESLDALSVEKEDADAPTSGTVGEKIEASGFLISGGSTVVSALTKAENKTLDGYSYEIDGDSFTPLAPGTYEVSCTVTDYLGSVATASYDVEVSTSPTPVFPEVSESTPILISGRKAIFDEVTALDYSSDFTNPTEVKATLSFTLEGSTADLPDREFTPSISSAKAIGTLTYSASNENGTSSLSRSYRVVNLYDEAGLDMSRYFYDEGFSSVSRAQSYIDFETSSDGASLTFVKDIPSYGFEIDFAIPSSKNLLESVDIELTNTDGSGRSVVFRIEKGPETDPHSALWINGVRKADIVGDFHGLSSQRIRVAYEAETGQVEDNSGLAVATISDYSDGTEFEGFTDEVSLKITLNGVTGAADFRLYQLGNQRFSSLEGDYTSPVVSLSGEMVRTASLGDTVEIVPAAAYDILSFGADVSLSVYSPAGEIILSEEDCSKGYSFEASEYGQYRIVFSASDENGNSYDHTLVVYVDDEVAPEIASDEDVPSSGKVGERISLPTLMADDNVDGAIACRIYLIDPDNQMSDITSDAGFTPKEEGRYIVRYAATDAAGNISFADYAIEVSAQ